MRNVVIVAAALATLVLAGCTDEPSDAATTSVVPVDALDCSSPEVELFTEELELENARVGSIVSRRLGEGVSETSVLQQTAWLEPRIEADVDLGSDAEVVLDKARETIRSEGLADYYLGSPSGALDGYSLDQSGAGEPGDFRHYTIDHDYVLPLRVTCGGDVVSARLVGVAEAGSGVVACELEPDETWSPTGRDAWATCQEPVA
ncbi:MAG: hypothetical protein M3Y20_08905 [Actinomycetota bacterium]|nr:hypothetical protein [Actinomycetota bacterium]